MFLTAIVLQFVVSNMLPKLGYLTIADKFVLSWDFFFIFFVPWHSFWYKSLIFLNTICFVFIPVTISPPKVNFVRMHPIRL